MTSKKPLFVTGIGTNIGKTIVSAVLVEKLKADYWKPVQSGDLNKSDSLSIQSLISNTVTKIQGGKFNGENILVILQLNTLKL